MKEFFPSPKTVVAHIEKSLANGSWSVANMPPAEKKLEPSQAEGTPTDSNGTDTNQVESEITGLSRESAVNQAEQIITEYYSQSLHELAAEVHIELPEFLRLIIMRYSSEEEQLRRGGNIWYGITADWKLSRYQFIPSSNMLTVCENTASSRFQEILMTLALKQEKARMSRSYEKSSANEQVQVLAKGFSITEEEAERLIQNMPLEEKMVTYPVKQTQLYL